MAPQVTLHAGQVAEIHISLEASRILFKKEEELRACTKALLKGKGRKSSTAEEEVQQERHALSSDW